MPGERATTGPTRAETRDRRPLAHGRAPVVGSRPLAHGDVTSSEMVALGTPETGEFARPGAEWLRMEGSGAGSVTATTAPSSTQTLSY